MADIMKDDVRTYVEELIKREFSTKSEKERILSDNGKTNADESRPGQHHP